MDSWAKTLLEDAYRWAISNLQNSDPDVREMAERYVAIDSILRGRIIKDGPTIIFRDTADTRDAVVATIDEDGNRTAVTFVP